MIWIYININKYTLHFLDYCTTYLKIYFFTIITLTRDYNICINGNNCKEGFIIRKRLRKRKRGEIDTQTDTAEENSEDGSITKSWITKSSTSEIQDTINISDDEEDSRNSDVREPSRFEPSVKPKQIERSTFKSVRDYFGEDEAVYIMDAKTTGNIGRYLNVGEKIKAFNIFLLFEKIIFKFKILQ